MDEILAEFKSESLQLLKEMMEILEEIEADPQRFEGFSQYGQLVDRIMGSAKTLEMTHPQTEVLKPIGQYTELCKAIGYRASQVKDNLALTQTTVAFLLDATETLEDMIQSLDNDSAFDLKNQLTKTFLDRLSWLNSQFDENLRATVAVSGQEGANTEQIERMLREMGLKS